MDASGHQLLAGPALSRDHDRSIRVGKHLHQLAHLQQRGRFAHQSVRRRSLAGGVSPRGVVDQRGVQRGEQGAQIVRLDQIVAGTGADGVHRQAHVAVSREHDHRWSQRRGPDAAQQFQAAAVRQHQVQEHDIHVATGNGPVRRRPAWWRTVVRTPAAAPDPGCREPAGRRRRTTAESRLRDPVRSPHRGQMCPSPFAGVRHALKCNRLQVARRITKSTQGHSVARRP